MGEVIKLAERREARRRSATPRRAVTRPSSSSTSRARSPTSRPSGSSARSTTSTWTPGVGHALRRGSLAADEAAGRRARRRRGARRALRLPLVWPETLAGRRPGRHARRLATRPRRPRRRVRARRRRLAFCGGFDLDDPEILAEAAAAAGLGSTTACAPPATARATARSRPPARRLLASAPTGCRRCASGARCSGARDRWPRRPPPRGSAPLAASAAARSLCPYGVTRPARICSSSSSRGSWTAPPAAGGRPGTAPRGRSPRAAARGRRRGSRISFSMRATLAARARGKGRRAASNPPAGG